MIEVFKILTKKYDKDISDVFHLRKDTTTRGHGYKIYKSRCRTYIRKYFFTERDTDIWNSLPVKVVNLPSVRVFKAMLDGFYHKENILQSFNYSQYISVINYPDHRADLIP